MATLGGDVMGEVTVLPSIVRTKAMGAFLSVALPLMTACVPKPDPSSKTAPDSRMRTTGGVKSAMTRACTLVDFPLSVAVAVIVHSPSVSVAPLRRNVPAASGVTLVADAGGTVTATDEPERRTRPLTSSFGRFVT